LKNRNKLRKIKMKIKKLYNT